MMSRTYQRSKEFKESQLWLDFQDAVGTALEAIADVVDQSRAWFKKWAQGFVTKTIVTDDSGKQMNFEFVIN